MNDFQKKLEEETGAYELELKAFRWLKNFPFKTFKELEEPVRNYVKEKDFSITILNRQTGLSRQIIYNFINGDDLLFDNLIILSNYIFLNMSPEDYEFYFGIS